MHPLRSLLEHPVYRRSGGLSYRSTYMGAIGVITMPTFDVRRYSELSFASTLNGSCTGRTEDDTVRRRSVTPSLLFSDLSFWAFYRCPIQ